MSRIVAPCHLHITLQAVLRSFEGLLANNGRHGNSNPCIYGGGLLTLA
jgi:hypothetical protein